MAKWSASLPNWIPKAAADSAGLVTSSIPAYHAMGNITGTNKVAVVEVYMGGQATSSAPLYMLLARDSLQGGSTAVSTAVGHTNAPLDPATNTLVSCVAFTSTLTSSQRSAAHHVLSLSYNGFGGIVRWVAPPGSEIIVFGSSQPFAEISLSAFTGTLDSTDYKMGSHIIYETY